MWNYTKKVIDHFLHPRNTGEIENPDGLGEVGSLACGDMLRLTFKLNDKGIISDAKFKTFGCASAIASSSALTEMIKGKTLEEALFITNKDIAEYLGGLPDEKMHCSVMGRETLEAAIENYRGEGTGKHELKGKVICKCYGITDEEIKEVAKANNLHSVNEITNYTKAGGGCGQCKEKIQSLLNEIDGKKNLEEDTDKNEEKLTNLEKMHKIEEMIETRIRPALQQDGGDIKLVEVDHDRIYVKLLGACATCPSSTKAMRQFVEKEIQKNISPNIHVEEA